MELVSCLGVIPARYQSSRFPGKPLADIKGKSMVRRVYEQAKQSTLLTDVVVATDDKRIYDHVIEFGGKAVITSAEAPSGTDRCLEAYDLVGSTAQFVVNIQGDEPFIRPVQINEVVRALDYTTEAATSIKLIDKVEQIFDEKEAKVTIDKNGYALYFSRAPIPFGFRKKQSEWLSLAKYYKHISVYAYRVDVLRAFTKLPQSMLEITESLEQLRLLENGYRIKCVITEYDSYSIDTPEDLANLEKMFEL